MTYLEFQFWQACMLKIASFNVPVEAAAVEADKCLAHYRKRAATVTDYYGDGLATKSGSAR